MANVLIRRDTEGRRPCEDRQMVVIQVQAEEHLGIPKMEEIGSILPYRLLGDTAC